MTQTTVNHKRVPDYPVSHSVHWLGLSRGRLGEWIQEVIDAGWRVETDWFVERPDNKRVVVQFAFGRWDEGTYRQIGGSDPNDFETAFLRAYAAWEALHERLEAGEKP